MDRRPPTTRGPILAAIVLAVLLSATGLVPAGAAHAVEPIETCPADHPPAPLDPPTFRCLADDGDGGWWQFSAEADDRIRIILEPGDDNSAGHLRLWTQEDGMPQTVVADSEAHINGSKILRYDPDEARTWYIQMLSSRTEDLLSITLNEQTETGSFLLGNEARVLGDPAWNIDQRQGPEDSAGFDGGWVRLDATGTGEERLELTHTGGLADAPVSAGTTSIFATLYDEEANELEGYHCDRFFEDLTCSVPEDAAWVLVESQISVNPGYELRYLY